MKKGTVASFETPSPEVGPAIGPDYHSAHDTNVSLQLMFDGPEITGFFCCQGLPRQNSSFHPEKAAIEMWFLCAI